MRLRDDKALFKEVLALVQSAADGNDTTPYITGRVLDAVERAYAEATPAAPPEPYYTCEACWKLAPLVDGLCSQCAAATAGTAPSDEGPVVQASLETREMVATLTRKWPVGAATPGTATTPPGEPGACNFGVVGCKYTHSCDPSQATHFVPAPPPGDRGGEG